MPSKKSGSLLRAVGFHAHLEHEVQKPDGCFRRAEIVALHRSGKQLAFDVQCTGFSDYHVGPTAHLTPRIQPKPVVMDGVAPGATGHSPFAPSCSLASAGCFPV